MSSSITSSGTLSQTSGSSTIVFTPTVGSPSNLDFTGGSGVSISASVTVTLSSDLSFNNVNQFFVIGGTGVTFDGSGNTVTIDTITSYPGLIKCSNATYITAIQNVGVLGATSTLLTTNGWVVQGYSSNTGYDAGITVSNCYSTGNISGAGSGGIFGSNSSGTATTCHSTGNINGDDAGGIFGYYPSGCNATSCYSTGNIIGKGSGGIFGSGDSFGGGINNTATSCYSTGVIDTSNASGGVAGGIFGRYGKGTATYCYSTGNIVDNNAGGIFGYGASGTAYNCYSTGVVTGTNSGGIISTNGTANNCYCIGTSRIGGNTIVNCIAYSGAWSDADATTTIYTGTAGTVWVLTTSETPWKLAAFSSYLSNLSGAISFASQTASTSLIGSDGNFYVFPITMDASSNVTLTGAITINTSVNNYFIVGGTGVTFDGSGNTVTIDTITSYPGLIKCSNATYITAIQNVGVLTSGGSTLAGNAGWVVQGYTSSGTDTNVTVSNCYSTGAISGGNAGGIFGAYSDGTASNCHSTGNISSGLGGGIFGLYSSGSATSCYSTGEIGPTNAPGGIFGYGSIGGTATYCYSTGNITAGLAGGIFSGDATSSTSATYCYSTGNITGSNAGGIFGTNSKGTATNCYSTGTASTGRGGIYGSGSTIGIATNCYCIGAAIIGGTTTPSNCIAYNTGIWSDADATTTIYTGTGGTVWILTTSSTPWKLAALASYLSNLSGSISFASQTASTSLIGSDGNVYVFPITIDASSNVTLTGAITINTSVNNYFIVGGSDVTFDGSSNTVTITDIPNYPGVFKCDSDSYTATVQNLGVLSSGTTTLAVTNGWVVQRDNDAGITVSGCYSTGDISGINCGGIFGGNSGGTANNCYSTGDITGILTGGIFGNGSNGTATNCYSIGTIYNLGGGIFGGNSGGTVNNCYSTGDIITAGNYGGGIFGFAGYGIANDCHSEGFIDIGCGGIFGQYSSGQANNCYSIGDISGNDAGGIFGAGSNGNATTCYSEGDISGTAAGGIFGSSSSSGTASACHSTGTIASGAGGIFGQGSGCTATSCYSEGIVNGGGIFAPNSSGTASACYSSGPIATNAGGIFGSGGTGTATTCYSTNSIASGAGGIFGPTSSGTASACYSSGAIASEAGGIFGHDSTGTAVGCHSTNTIAADAGGIFGKTSGGTASNCYSEGNITGGGGIYGSYSTGTATDCHSTGTINSGGIFGPYSTGTASNCYSEGAIEDGGIFGHNSTATAINCYSTGIIGGTSNVAGGIFGYACVGTATNCYSIGNVTGSASGGIFGQGCNGSVATACYSTGNITGTGGGIFGADLAGGTATNCYSTGTINGGGIFARSSSGVVANNCYTTGTVSGDGSLIGGASTGTATNCYAIGGTNTTAGTLVNCIVNSSGVWADSSASTTINTGYTGSAVWTDIDTASASVPWLLSSFNTPFYDPSFNFVLPPVSSTYTSGAGTFTANTTYTPPTPIDPTYKLVSTTQDSLATTISFNVPNGNITFDNISSSSGLSTAKVVGYYTVGANKVGYSIFTYELIVETNNITTDVSFAAQTGSNYLLGSDGVYYDFPISIDAGVTVSLTGDIIIDSSFANIFIINASGVVFNGAGHTVTIADILSYPGLFQCNSSSFVATIENVGVLSTGTTTLVSSGGWVVQGTGLDAGITATNCYSTGDISNFFAGGIFGQNSSGIANYCYSTGAISSNAGGIFGSSGTATNCYSTGDIASDGGGIFCSSGTGTATNCYSTGAIITGAGGIFGSGSTGTATNCYSSGDIIDYAGGGIFGRYAGSGTANNCYSTGVINGNACGGIYGLQSSGTANNCYSTGTIIGGSAGGIFGNISTGIPTNCYCIGGTTIGGSGTPVNCIAVSGSWFDASANSTIYTGTSGLVWTDIDTTSTSVPWLLSSFNSNVYDPSFATAYTTTYDSGNGLFGYNSTFTGSSIAPSYQIISTVNSPTVSVDSSGNLAFSSISGGVTYTVNVLAYYDVSSNIVGYNLNSYTLYGSGDLPCFLKGTKIKTSQTEYKLIEDLKQGDKVYTPDGRFVSVLKINDFTTSADESTSPYIVPRGYHGANEFVCDQDLYLSPDHGVLCDYENIVLAKSMGFKQDMNLSKLHYYHLTLPNFFTDHVIANGVACESYGRDFLLQCNNNMDILSFHFELLNKVYCKKTLARKHITSKKYNVLLDHFIGGNPNLENSQKYMISSI